MIQCRSLLILVCRTSPPNRRLSFTIPMTLNQKFRQERGLPLNPNASGVLVDSPDFSYLDGRLTPLGQGQRRRVIRQREVKSQIITLSKEIDFAVERYEQLLIEKERRKEQILKSKLKPKGTALLGPTKAECSTK